MNLDSSYIVWLDYCYSSLVFWCNMKVYFFEYEDPWGTFERTSIKATDTEEAWYKIKKYVGKGSVVLKVFEPVFDGRYQVED